MPDKKSKKKKFYITTSIAYTNAPPHIGFALELIQADVLARHHRISGEDVFFLTGTDEHGAKITKAAEKAGRNPKDFADEISAQYKELAGALNLSNDDFVRTTDQKRHWPAVKKAWLQLKNKGDIYKKKYKGLYCVGCEAFITKKDLKDGKCVIHRSEPAIMEEENYFFRLSKYSKKIEKIIKEDQIEIIPRARKNEALNFVKQGLEDISFSRPRKDLQWAIPVPDDNAASIYVWADALANYISAIGYFNESGKFKKYWPADVHCIGKDILKFHAAIWPGMLLSLGIRLPKKIFVHGFINVGGQKMSKSLGNVIDPLELVGKYGTDAVRYFLLREIPPTEDGDFTYEKFEARYNSDLAKGLGNLTARVITLADKLKIKNPHRAEPSYATESPDFRSGYRQISKLQIKNQKVINDTWKNYKKALEEFKFSEALIAVWNLISFCDRYIEKERPWEESGNQQPAISNLLYAVGNIAQMLQPFLPETSEKIFQQLGVKAADKIWKFKVKKGEALFPRI